MALHRAGPRRRQVRRRHTPEHVEPVRGTGASATPGAGAPPAAGNVPPRDSGPTTSQPTTEPTSQPTTKAATEPTTEAATEPTGGPARQSPQDSHEPAQAPTDLPKRSWKGVLRRTIREFKDDNLGDWAAALTYYGVLSIFPAMIALVSIVGLLGTSQVNSLIDNVRELAPGAVQDTLVSMLEQMRDGAGKAGIALAIGVLVALWSASGYVAAFMRASNAVYDIGEGRPVWKTLPTRLAITVVVVLLLAALAVGVVFTGTLAKKAGEVIGVGDTAVTVWNIAKWPVMLLLFSLIVALLYWAAPNVKRGMRWVSPGSLIAVLIWVVASAAFAVYVANFSSYNKTYGSLAAVIIFLVWLWISNLAILLGLEFNAELERGRAIDSGHPPAEEPYVEPRDTRKL